MKHRVPPHRHSQAGRPNAKGGKPNKYAPHMGKKQMAKALRVLAAIALERSKKSPR